MNLEEKSVNAASGEEETAVMSFKRDRESAHKGLPVRRQFVSFQFYRVRPEFRFLSVEEQTAAKKEFAETVQSFRKDVLYHSYSLVGLRKNIDFMLWRISYDLDKLQEMSAQINRTVLGRYLEVVESMLSMTKRSLYIDKLNPDHEEDRLHIIPGKGKYLFVYPFVKTRAWYMADAEKRQLMMDEHIIVGTKYQSVRIHTTYSYGLDDQEFVVAFETDNPSDFLDLVEALRFTKASEYTLRDTPMYTCRQFELAECLDAIA